jgi:aspartate racemase
LLSSGQIEFLGRTDHQVKLRSYRIELGEVEAAAESNPDVHQAVALVRGGNLLVLFVAARAGSSLEPAMLQQWLTGKLVEWMVPTSVVLLDKLPMTTGGKIDRAALSAMPVHTALITPRETPQTDLQRDLLNIWERLFQKSGIGIDDNFFSLGGYSLLAMRMLIEVEKATGQALRFAQLNRAPTIRELAKLVTGEVDDDVPECLVVIRKSQKGFPLYCMHGAGGVTHWYNDLASSIEDRPVIGIQCIIHPGTPMPATLEEMAENYMDAIRKFQPAGPYHFIGHSMGGMLAYQCAVNCERRGDAVGFAGTLDGWYRAADNPSTLEKVGRLLKYYWALNLTEKLEFLTEKLAWIRTERSRKKELSSIEMPDSSVLESIKLHNARLAREYVAPTWPGVFHVFRARKRSASQNPDPSLGWAEVAENVVNTEIPGTHYTLLSPPNVETLAGRLRAKLDGKG